MTKKSFAVLFTTCLVTMATAPSRGATSSQGLQIDADDIGGIVTSSKGPESGIWVIAETDDLPTNFIKIVVTDERGRYVIPDLPKAKYKVWTRGYGLLDSKAIDAVPGKVANLTATLAPDPRAAADYYPANYWYALLHLPPADQFPGTGPKGNGIAPSLATQQDWLARVKEECLYCHQLGDMVTRTLSSTGDSAEGWSKRLANGTGLIDDPRINRVVEGSRKLMGNNITRLGGHRGLEMLGNWTDRIAAGEIPAEPPPRPSGLERNVVLSMWGWAKTEEGLSMFVHDEVSTDRRNPTLGAAGPVYGLGTRYGQITYLDPTSHQSTNIPIPAVDASSPHDLDNMPHNPMLDQNGRLWFTLVSQQGAPATFCDSSGSVFGKNYPNPSKAGRTIGVYDPKTKKVDLMPTCFGTHHLGFSYEKDNILYFSGDSNVIGWINTRIWDQTHSPEKAEGWCPMVIDTNGDGKISSDRTQWNELKLAGSGGGEGGGGASDSARHDNRDQLDPKKDTRFSSFLYGMNTSPTDGSVWFAKFSPTVPSGIVRFEPGANPPQTCKTEFFEPPKRADNTYAAFDARGVDLDSKGVAWVGFGSGQLASFDRRKCKVLNGPSTTGQQCPEGWSFHDSPGPKVTGVKEGSADWHYLVWVDQFNTFGLGKDIPILPGTNSDSLAAFLPETKKWVVLRVPYPMGFYTRGMDGRIDDAKAGWKGKGLWATYSMSQHASLHTEGGEGKLVQFQLRPDPLAH